MRDDRQPSISPFVLTFPMSSFFGSACGVRRAFLGAGQFGKMRRVLLSMESWISSGLELRFANVPLTLLTHSRPKIRLSWIALNAVLVEVIDKPMCIDSPLICYSIPFQIRLKDVAKDAGKGRGYGIHLLYVF
jgi:hypothetical protein